MPAGCLLQRGEEAAARRCKIDFAEKLYHGADPCNGARIFPSGFIERVGYWKTKITWR